MSYITFSMNAARILAGKLFPPVRRSFTSRQVLEKNFPAGSDFCFVQVGAADGVSHDFLFDFVRTRNASGVVIEPLPDLYKKLSSNYAFNPAIVPVNVAVHASQKEVDLYRVDESLLDQAPGWASGIGSIDPAHHKKSGIDTKLMVSTKVPAERLMKIIEDHLDAASIDFLQIDAEGYDHEVLRQFDFKRYQPLIIRFEYINLSVEQVNAAIGFLKKQGYHCIYDDIDILAVDLWRARL